jgi:hypothetical protein
MLLGVDAMAIRHHQVSGTLCIEAEKLCRAFNASSAEARTFAMLERSMNPAG